MQDYRSALLPMAFLISALLALAPRAQAGDLERVRIAYGKRVGDQLTMTVSTPGGPALPSRAFSVSVNGLPGKNVRAVSRFGPSRSSQVVLVIDTSSSMTGEPLAEAKKAVNRFLDTIQPGTQVGLIRFASTTEIVTPLTQDYELVKSGAATLNADGETAVSDAIQQAVGLGLDSGKTERNIVVLSDGAGSTTEANFDEALVAARSKGAIVSVVGIRSTQYVNRALGDTTAGPSTTSRYARWAKLSADTGGILVETDDTSKLAGIFEDIANNLTSSYQIEMTDPDPLATETQVKIAVEVGSQVMTGSRLFSFPVPDVDPSSGWNPFSFVIPLPVFLVGVFAGVGGVAFLGAEGFRRKKVSPAERIAWYNDGDSRTIDADALINAAVLQRAKELATELAGRTGYLERIEKEVEGAGMKWRPGEVIVASLLLSVVGGLLGYAIGGWVMGLILAPLGGLGPTLFIKHKAASRRRAFYKQLSDVLILLTGGLRAGYSMQQAAGAVADDAQPPASEEFRRVMAEVRLGASLEESLKAMARRVDIIDFDWTVLAIEIQREVGGDLGEILETIAETIRSRERLRGRVKTLTAEGRLSALVLGALPFLMAGLISMRSPAYLETLYTTAMGLKMVGASVFMMIIGIFWMKKIINIEV